MWTILTDRQTDRLTVQEQNMFYIMKIFACISVIAAHVNNYVYEESKIDSIVTGFWSMYAQCGVIVFFLLSGFFFKKEAGFRVLAKKKSKRIIIPWVVCASMTYLLMLLRSQGNPTLRYFQWVLGYGSWYYYLTVLVVILLLFQLLSISDTVIFICVAVNLVFIGCRTFWVKDAPIIPYLTDYLNPLNWVGFFALGIFIKKYEVYRKMSKCQYMGYLALVIFALSSIYNIRKSVFTYFNLSMVITELSGAVVVFYLAIKLARRKLNWRKIGESTFFIYLVHMQVVQFVSARIPDGLIKYAINPIFNFAIMIIITLGMYKVLSKWRFGKNCLMILGISKA